MKMILKISICCLIFFIASNASSPFLIISKLKGENAFSVQDSVLIQSLHELIKNGIEDKNKYGYIITPNLEIRIIKNSRIKEELWYVCDEGYDCYVLKDNYKIKATTQIINKINSYLKNNRNKYDFKYYELKQYNKLNEVRILLAKQNCVIDFIWKHKKSSKLLLGIWQPSELKDLNENILELKDINKIGNEYIENSISK
jgi:hypothetical protein